MERSRRNRGVAPAGPDPYLAEWVSLSPAERLRRSWRLRRRIPDLAAVHDAKTFPEL